MEGQYRQCSREDLARKFCNVRFMGGEHVGWSKEQNLYAVTARSWDGQDDNSDNVSVHTAACELLTKASEAGYKTIHLQLPSVGGSVPPVYGFIEAVRAFGCWKRDHANDPLRVLLYVGPEVVLNLTSHRIDLQELLSSDLTRFWTIVSFDSDSSPDPVRRACYYRTDQTPLRTILDEMQVPPSEDWQVSISPSPRHGNASRTAAALAEKSLMDIGVVFGSVLTLERVAAAGRAVTAGD
jgi:hypothetical protein